MSLTILEEYLSDRRLKIMEYERLKEEIKCFFLAL